jgi:hypothetical protein
MSILNYLTQELTPKLPTSWIVIPYARNVEQIHKTTCMYVRREVGPGSRIGSLSWDVSVYILCPITDDRGSELKLDEYLEDLLPEIRDIPNIEFIVARKQVFDDTYPMWDIQLRIETSS